MQMPLGHPTRKHILISIKLIRIKKKNLISSHDQTQITKVVIAQILLVKRKQENQGGCYLVTTVATQQKHRKDEHILS